MTTRYERENLLRNPVEYWAAAAYLIGILILLLMPEVLLMPPMIALMGAGLLSLRGMQRFLQAHRLHKYQKQLLQLPHFVRSSDQIGHSDHHLWLGKGFEWDERHTQRLFDLEQQKNRKFREMPKMWQRVRRFEKRFERHPLFQSVAAFTRSNSAWNLWKPLPDIGGSSFLHGVGMWEGEQDIVQNLSERVAHTLVLGTTRVGKTRLAETLISQDIRRGDVVIVIDPKGDGDLLLRCYVECLKAGRLDHFHIFHLGYPDISESYNPIGNFMRTTEVASRIAGQMPSEGQSATFKEFVWGYVNSIAQALIEMGKQPSFSIIKQYSEKIDPLFVEYMEWLFSNRAASNWLQEIRDSEEQLGMKKEDRHPEFNRFEIPKELYGRSHRTIALYKYYQEHPEIRTSAGDSLVIRVNYAQSHMSKLIASLNPFLDKMMTGDNGALLVPDGTKPILDWNNIIQQKGVVYVGLDALSDAEVAAAVGNSMLADLTSIAGRIYKTGSNYGLPDEGETEKPRICLHADEFNEVAGAEFIPMLNKAGGAGICTTAYTQTSSDVAARLGGNTFKAAQMFGNFNTKIFMRVLDLETAKLLVNGLKRVTVTSVDMISGTADSPDVESNVSFTSSTSLRHSKQQVDTLSPNELLQLPKGQAFMLNNGGKLCKFRVPLPDARDFNGIPKDIRDVAKSMKSGYSSDVDTFRFNEYLTPQQTADLWAEARQAIHPDAPADAGGYLVAMQQQMTQIEQLEEEAAEDSASTDTFDPASEQIIVDEEFY